MARRSTFDIVGDVHGCGGELLDLLAALGHTGSPPRHPEGRRAVFVGDLTCRGPDTPAVVETVMAMCAAGSALCVPGNHDVELATALRDGSERPSRGVALAIEQLRIRPAELTAALLRFLDSLPGHRVLDAGRLVVAHAGLPEAMHRSRSRAAWRAAVFGPDPDSTGDDRLAWAGRYRGAALVVFGHVAGDEVRWRNRTVCIDTGCVYGGRLSALRYPELEVVGVAARAVWWRRAGAAAG